jgi:glycosyltransferase involved in cell wall biosynthesis
VDALEDRPRRPRALAVISDVPWPARSGNHWRYLQNLRLLAELGYDVHVVAGHVRDDLAAPDLGGVGKAHAVIRVRNQSSTSIARVRRISSLAGHLLAAHPRNPWAMEHVAAGFDDAVVQAARELAPEAVLLRSTFAHLVPRLRPLAECIAVDAHDSDALFARALRTTSVGWQTAGLRLRELGARRAEREFLGADELWVPAPREVEYFRRRLPGLHTILVPNGVPVSPTPPTRDPDGRTLLLFGGFGLPMNLAAADALIDEVLPAVRAACPDCRVDLIGTDLPEDRLERWRELPVRWLGRVDDLAPHLARAQAFVFVPPPGFGSGTPLKVSEALAAAVPLVTTPVIGDQLGLVSGDNAIVGSDVPELAEGIVSLLEDPAIACRIAAAGHSRALELLSFESVLERARSTSLLASAAT